MSTVEDFEQKIWEIESIRVVVRASEGTKIADYDYKKAADQGVSVTKWLAGRVLPKLNGAECVVISGNGEQPHGRSLLRTVRESYAKD